MPLLESTMRPKDIPILAYFDIATNSPDRNCVLLNDFKKQLEFMKSNNFHCIPIKDIENFFSSENTEIKNFSIALIGSSDGFSDASDILNETGFTATWFVDIDDIGKAIDPDDLMRVSKKGIDFGITIKYPLDLLDDEHLNKELKKSEILSALGIASGSLSYALSTYDDPNILDLAKERISRAGFKTAICTREMFNGSFLDRTEFCITRIDRTVNLGKLRTITVSPTLSVCMIVKNEQSCLKRCLDSIKTIADEIVIVDTGSTDQTKDIAKEFKAKIFDFRWTDNFADARNFSLKQAKSEWILVLDADEEVNRHNLVNIKKLLTLDFDAYNLILRNYSDNESDIGFIHTDQTADYLGYLPVPLPRLFRNQGFYYSNAVHETIDESLMRKKAKIGETDITIEHLEILKGKEAIKKKQLIYMEYAKSRLDKDPGDLKAICDIGVIAMNFLDDDKVAESYFQMALDLNHKFARARLLLGQLYAKQKKYNLAIEQYEFAAKIDRDSETIAKENIRKILAIR